MEYYKLLQLEREPFSNSPDPAYFFLSDQHQSCIQKLEVALRLKRGLNVVIGDVGTGKTTLCREVIRKLSQDPQIQSHLILDPAIPTAEEFLAMIHSILCGDTALAPLSTSEKKEAIKQGLFQKGVQENKTIILIIDEGQKLTPVCMEILRELLNYETNTHKLLQIAIFAQQEFYDTLNRHPNFADRINMLHHLKPLNFGDTRKMIHHRLKLASKTPQPRKLFTLPALWAIYRATNGYPRRIIHLCHQSVLAMIIQNRSRAGWALVRSCRNRIRPAATTPSFLIRGTLAALILIVISIAGLLYAYPRWAASLPRQQTRSFPVSQSSQADSAADTSIEPISIDQHLDHPVQTESPKSMLLSQAEIPLEKDLNTSAALETTIQPEITGKNTDAGVNNAPLFTAPATINDGHPNLNQQLPERDTAPALLGEVRVKKGDTLYKMILNIYGAFQMEYLRAVLSANTQITDPNAIAAGIRILFPAIEFEVNPILAQCYWIILEKIPTLAQARDRYFQLSTQLKAPMQIIGSWSPHGELEFLIAIRGYFATQEKAVSYQDHLPNQWAAQARVIRNLPAGAKLFADAYAAGVREQ